MLAKMKHWKAIAAGIAVILAAPWVVGPSRVFLASYLMSPSFKSHLENAYFLSGVLLVGTLLIGLRQLRQNTRISRTQSQREAFRIAAERCDYFGQTLLPMAHQLEKAFKESGVQLLEKCKVTIGENSIKLDPKAVTKADQEAANSHALATTQLLNGLEGFAAFFVSRIADDNLGFLLCGHAYCDFFEAFFPLYALSGALEHHAQATQALYGRWKKRISHEELLRKQAEIAGKLGNAKSYPIKPIGTE